jgi:hypothetical protein
MTRSASTASFFLLSLWVLSTALPAAATTYQMMSDGDLTDQANVAAEVRVVSVEPAPANRQVATDYLVEVDSVLKGSLPGTTIVVRVPGGIGANGIGLKIWGAPAFTPGERAILFLQPANDGTYGILHLMLGAFRERPTLDGRKAAFRDLSEAHALGNPAPERHRDLAAFSRWILDRGLGLDRPADYFLPEGTRVVHPAREKFGFLVDPAGAGHRWFRFDQNRTVEWRVFESGQPGLNLDETVEAFKVAVQTWNDDPGTDIRYAYAGTTAAQAAFEEYDGVSAILFDDPHRGAQWDVPGSYSCPGGGTIAIGGAWFYVNTYPYGDYYVHETVEGDIITNEGTDCLFRNNRTAAEEVFAHELGHTLGLGHSSDRDALMFAEAHNDGRGAVLKPDDMAGAAEFYSVKGPLPTKAPAAPSGLNVRAIASNWVSIRWQDKANNEGGFILEAKVGKKGTFREVGSIPANITSITESGLIPGETYSFRMRAYNRKGFSRYSNTVTIKMPR